MADEKLAKLLDDLRRLVDTSKSTSPAAYC